MQHSTPKTGTAVISPFFAHDDVQAQDSWASYDDEMIRLDGMVIDNNIDGSDSTLLVRAPDGFCWTIELADRVRNEKAGLHKDRVASGDRLTVLGKRIGIFAETRIKAVQLIIADRDHTLYPELLENI